MASHFSRSLCQEYDIDWNSIPRQRDGIVPICNVLDRVKQVNKKRQSEDTFLQEGVECDNGQAVSTIAWCFEKRCSHDVPRFSCTGPLVFSTTKPLRDYQEHSVHALVHSGVARSGMIVVPCGGGKTAIMLSAALRLGHRCLFVMSSLIAASQLMTELRCLLDEKSMQSLKIIMMCSGSDTRTHHDDIPGKARGKARGKKPVQSGSKPSRRAHLLRLLKKLASNSQIPNQTSILGKRPVYTQASKCASVEDILKADMVVTTYDRLTHSALDPIMSQLWACVIFDEAHRSAGMVTNSRIQDILRKVTWSFTATPDRLDGRDVVAVANTPVLKEVSIKHLVCQSHIAKVQRILVQVPPVDGVHAALNPYKYVIMSLILEYHLKLEEDCIVFCHSISALKLAHRYISARHDRVFGPMHEKTPMEARRRMVAEFQKRGGILFLSEGTGDEGINVIPKKKCHYVRIDTANSSFRSEAQSIGRVHRGLGPHCAYILLDQGSEADRGFSRADHWSRNCDYPAYRQMSITTTLDHVDGHVNSHVDGHVNSHVDGHMDYMASAIPRFPSAFCTIPTALRQNWKHVLSGVSDNKRDLIDDCESDESEESNDSYESHGSEESKS